MGALTEVEYAPKWMRRIAGACYLMAFIVAATALAGLFLVIAGRGPDWNVAERFGVACTWGYVGALHSTIARLRERKVAPKRVGMCGRPQSGSEGARRTHRRGDLLPPGRTPRDALGWRRSALDARRPPMSHCGQSLSCRIGGGGCKCGEIVRAEEAEKARQEHVTGPRSAATGLARVIGRLSGSEGRGMREA